MDEMKLYQKMKAGDSTAFDAIFQLHYERLVKSLYLKNGDLSLSEDIVQTIFIEFWTKRTTLNIETSIGAYLNKAVNNRWIDHFRKAKNIKIKEEEYFKNALLLDVSSPETDLLSKENLKAIYTKIEALPLKCKVVFKLSRLEKKTYAEIAEDLDISVKTVEFHMSTALRILRKTIFIWVVFTF